MPADEIYILTKENLVETSKKVTNYRIEELAQVLDSAKTSGDTVYVYIRYGTRDREDNGYFLYQCIPRSVQTEGLKEHMLTEEAWLHGRR